jgi:hypothetical protein
MVVQISKSAKLERKQVDDVLGGEEAWKNVAKTESELVLWHGHHMPTAQHAHCKLILCLQAWARCLG